MAAEEKKTENKNIAAGFLFKKTLPLQIGLGAFNILSFTGLAVYVRFHIDGVLYVSTAFIALGSLGLLFVGVLKIHKYGQQLEESLQVMSAQLDDFSKGDIKISSVRHQFPTIERLQE